MAVPTVVAGATIKEDTANALTRNIVIPANITNDLVFLVVVSDSPTGTISSPSFPNYVYQDVRIQNNVPADQATFTVMWKVATGETGNYAIDTSITERVGALCFAVRGASTGALHFVATAITQVTSTTVTIPAVTSTVIDTLRLSFVGTDGLSLAHGAATGHTFIEDAGATSAGSVSASWKNVPTISTDASATVTIGVSEQWVGTSILVAPPGGTIYNKTVSGSITPTATVTRRLTRSLGGTLAPAAIVSKRLARALAGSLTSAAIVSRQLTRLLGANISLSGSVTANRSYLKILAGSINLSGTVTKRLSRSLVGAILPTGTVRKILTRTIVGTVNSAALLSKRLARALYGTVSLSGSISTTRTYLKILAGSVGLSGTAAKSLSRSLAGSVTPNSAINKTLTRALAGAVGAAGAVRKIAIKLLGGAITPTSALVSRRIFPPTPLGGVVTPAGSLNKVLTRRLTAALAPSGTLTFSRQLRVIVHKPRGTIFSSDQLSFTYSSPIWHYDNHYGDLTQDVISYGHSISSTRGFHTADLTLRLPLVEVEKWLEEGIGHEIKVRGQGTSIVWEGIVNKVTVNAGGYVTSRGPYLDIVNKVKLLYSKVIQMVEGSSTGISMATEYLENLGSQSHYGILGKTYSTGNIDEVIAAELQNMLLDRYSVPMNSEDLSLPGESRGISYDVKLECVGYSSMLEKYTYTDTTDGTQTLSTKIESILNVDPNVLFSNRSIGTNDLLVPRYESDTEAYGAIKALLAMGNSLLERHVFGVYENRKVIYRPVTQDKIYIRPLREGPSIIQTQDGGDIPIWQFRPGYYIRITDLLPGRPNGTDYSLDRHTLFAETVQYRMPDSLIINGAHSFKIEQRLAQLGISGIS